jgi:hypothetical protein
LGVFWIMDHYTVLHFGTCFIAWRALVHPPTADRHQPTHHAPAISSNTFETRAALGLLRYALIVVTRFPPVVQLEQ